MRQPKVQQPRTQSTKDAVTKDAVTKDKDAAIHETAPQATPKTQLKPPVMQSGDKDDTPIERAPGDTSRREVQKPLYSTSTGRLDGGTSFSARWNRVPAVSPRKRSGSSYPAGAIVPFAMKA